MKTADDLILSIDEGARKTPNQRLGVPESLCRTARSISGHQVYVRVSSVSTKVVVLFVILFQSGGAFGLLLKLLGPFLANITRLAKTSLEQERILTSLWNSHLYQLFFFRFHYRIFVVKKLYTMLVSLLRGHLELFLQDNLGAHAASPLLGSTSSRGQKLVNKANILSARFD